MKLDSIWEQDGDYLTNPKQEFKARSTGCSCCSCDLDTEDEVWNAAAESLAEIMIACNYFGWSIKSLASAAKKTEKVKKWKGK